MAARIILSSLQALRLMSSFPHLRIALRTPRFTRRRGGCIRWKLFRRPSASPSLSSPKSLLSQQTANLRKSQSRSRWRPPRLLPPSPFRSSPKKLAGGALLAFSLLLLPLRILRGQRAPKLLSLPFLPKFLQLQNFSASSFLPLRVLL